MQVGACRAAARGGENPGKRVVKMLEGWGPWVGNYAMLPARSGVAMAASSGDVAHVVGP